ncbi:Nuclear cap-binding protein subunit 1 [Galdieria sulphuraria]|uniref:Nuclear cap-binding protein subunit 1 n=1 Tax=Galdieria sulphuraria TaxID=130081 RepID=M2XU86_GALSU|nr:nuclear cap-binding protein subunit 1 [Galdieria sulphuraria]EME27228.1 nuclear cap-binding protein subunit 1 [Galdieria sulphuraria]GJD07543.1 Nuclear cap-binding protein subunit 1 [Galdieria sulphuraria]|eukprot:XP_005703748.1 nuclear cap-binding protein subunit 1 [Galdieria sulphuraria]
MEQKRVLHYLARIGDKVKHKGDLESQVSKASETLRPKFSGDFKEIADALVECAIFLPQKSVAYAVLGGVLAASGSEECYSFVQYLAESIRDRLERDLHSCSFRSCRAVFRFCANLTQAAVFSPKSFLRWLEIVIDEALKSPDSSLGGNPQARREWLFCLCTTTLPWCGNILRERCAMELKSLLDKIFLFGQKATDVSDEGEGGTLSFEDLLVPMEQNWLLGKIHKLRKVMQRAEAEEWPRKYVHWLYDAFDTTLARGLETSLPSLSIPLHSKNHVYPFPEYELLVGMDSQTDISHHAHDTNSDNTMQYSPTDNDADILRDFYASELVSDTIDSLKDNHSLAAAVLLSFSFSEVEPFVDEMQTHLHIIRAILSKMVHLPTTDESILYYHVLLIDLCYMEGSQAPLKLLMAVEEIFDMADKYDAEVFDRLTDWFARHLSNFGYKWNWDDWVFVTDKETYDTEKQLYQLVFCKDVLYKCLRLSYFEHISSAIPASLRELLIEPGKAILNETEEETAVAKELAKHMIGKERKNASEIEEFLSLRFPFESSLSSAFCTLCRALLIAGSKTFSHFDVVTERYLGLLRKLFAMDRANMKRLIMSEMKNYWNSSPQHLEYVLEKLWLYRIIDCSTVFDAAIPYLSVEADNEKVLSELSVAWRWKFVRKLFDRVKEHVQLAKDELSMAAQAASQATEGEIDAANLRLKNAQTANDNAIKEQKELFLHALRRSYAIIEALEKNSDNSLDETEGVSSSHRFRNLISICKWRVLGSMKETIRKHLDLLETTSWESLKATLNFQMPIQVVDVIFQESKQLLKYCRGITYNFA